MSGITLADAEVRSVKVIQVIEVTFPRGAGVSGDPVREVTQYWTMDGNLLLEKDEWRKNGFDSKSIDPTE